MVGRSFPIPGLGRITVVAFDAANQIASYKIKGEVAGIRHTIAGPAAFPHYESHYYSIA